MAQHYDCTSTMSRLCPNSGVTNGDCNGNMAHVRNNRATIRLHNDNNSGKIENYFLFLCENKIVSSCDKWTGYNKLRTCRLFKKELETECYLKNVLNRKHQSALAKFCCGVAFIRLETGRYEHLDIYDRICPICNQELKQRNMCSHNVPLTWFLEMNYILHQVK